jgi:hypothetical protein
VSEAKRGKKEKQKEKRGNPTQHESAFATGDFGGVFAVCMYVGSRIEPPSGKMGPVGSAQHFNNM